MRTEPPWTKNVSPLKAQSAVARYTTKGRMLAGSHTSKAPASGGAWIISPSPGVARVRRVRAAGAMQLLLTP